MNAKRRDGMKGKVLRWLSGRCDNSSSWTSCAVRKMSTGLQSKWPNHSEC